MVIFHSHVNVYQRVSLEVHGKIIELSGELLILQLLLPWEI